VLEGEFTFKIGEEGTTGGPGTCAFLPRNVPHPGKTAAINQAGVVFLDTPAVAGASSRDARAAGRGDLKKRLEESGWEVLGPNPL